MKTTQNFKLYEALKSGEAISTEKLVEVLAIKQVSLPVYIHAFKKAIALKTTKSEVVSIRDGRNVVAYQLTNPDELQVSYFTKAVAAVAKPVASGNKLIATSSEDDVDELDALESSARELADIHSSLGLNVVGSTVE